MAVFATEEQFADAIGNDNKRLLEIWNSLSGVTPVKKFANRKVASERIWKAVQGLGAPTTAPEDSIGTPDPVATEHQAAIESAAHPVEALEANAELVTAGAQSPTLRPRRPSYQEGQRRQERAQRQEGR